MARITIRPDGTAPEDVVREVQRSEAARPRRTVYVRAEDQAVWDQAEQLAQARGDSLSPLIAQALREYVAQHRVQSDQVQRIEVDTWNRDGQLVRRAFRGRWLIDPDEAYRSEYEGHDGRMAGLCYAVAQTEKGRFVAYTVHKNDPERWHWFEVFESLSDMEGKLPGDVLSQLASSLTGDRVATVELDI